MSPDKFIPLAEENFLIRDIGIEVLRQSCQLLQLWAKDPVLKDKFIAVNVSPIQLDDDDFVATVKQVILEAGVEPQNIELELTESALCLSLVEARKKIQALRDFGIRWALDDFGSGFSSLGILSVLPVHKLKIDRQFLKEVENSESSITLLRKILEISEVMGMEATVEGVENPSQFKMLVGLGCNSFQGYLFGRPQSAEQVTYAIKECAST
ncbi:UNVERIFIED_ORG: EAL domain-containing protein (putative c-di-GMP-specific phosphodiesterase class I) [Comamonas terrigena]